MTKVSALPQDPGPAGWNLLLPERTPKPALAGRQRADVVIIGAGFAGLSCAERLRQIAPELSVIVLEASEVGLGPAGRNSGFMIDLPHDLAAEDYATHTQHNQTTTTLNRASIRFAQALSQHYAMPDQAFVLTGKINAAASEIGVRHNQRYAEHLSAINEAYTLLDHKQMRSLTGIDYYENGLFTPGTALIQPAMYIRALADGLCKENAITLYEHSPVIATDKQPDHWRIQTQAGEVLAEDVVLAVNGHLQSFGYFQRHLLHTFTYAAMTRPLTATEAKRLGGESSWALTPAHPMGTTVRKLDPSAGGAGRLVVRNRFTLEPNLKASKRRMHDVNKSLIAAFRARFPMLPDLEFEWVWGGRLCLSINDVQIIGELDENLFAACCQNGLGACKGTLAGIVSAEVLVQKLQIEFDSLVPDYQADPPPRALLPEPLSSFVGNRVIRFKEWRAGSEL